MIAIMLAPWLAAFIAVLAAVFAAAFAGGAGVNAAATVSAAIVAAGFITSVAASIASLTTESIGVQLGASSIRLDALALILSMLVLGLSALIQAFAIRYLRGDRRQAWFVVSANLLTGFTVLLVCAGSVVIFAVAWVGAGAALVALLATYWPLAQAREGVRATAIRFIVADTALMVAVAILLVSAGTDVSLSKLGDVATSLPPGLQLSVAALVVLAAMARSSQIPFQGWLPFTLAAPTPVSALMHAGAVNAGAIMLIRFAPAIAHLHIIMIAIFLAGAATLVYATVMRLVRADVKGRLVFSTMAQMGFMIMACGLGLFAAAIFHLVAHSLFKSALFLGAGSGVRQHGVDRDLPPRQPRSRPAFVASVSLSVVVPVLAIVGAEVVFTPTTTLADLGLLVFVALTATVALVSALITNFTLRTAALGIVATVALAFAYVASRHVFTAVLDPAITIDGAPAWLLILPALGLLLAQLLSQNRRRLRRVGDHIYVRSLATAVPRPFIATGVPS